MIYPAAAIKIEAMMSQTSFTYSFKPNKGM
jgi:hypothetical protein